MPIELPDTKGQQLQTNKEPVTISVDKAGKVFIQETEIKLDEIAPKLRAIAKSGVRRADLHSRRQGNRLRHGDAGDGTRQVGRLHQGFAVTETEGTRRLREGAAVRGGLVTSVIAARGDPGVGPFHHPGAAGAAHARARADRRRSGERQRADRLRQGARNAKQLEAQPKEAPKAEPGKKEAPKPDAGCGRPASAATPSHRRLPRRSQKEEPNKEVAAVAAPAGRPAAAVARAGASRRSSTSCSRSRSARPREQRKAEEQKRAPRKPAQAGRAQEEARGGRRRRKPSSRRSARKSRKRREAEAKKKQFDAENIAALLNKMPDKGAPRPSVPLDEQAKAKGPVLGAPEGRDRTAFGQRERHARQIIQSAVAVNGTSWPAGRRPQHTQVKHAAALQSRRSLAAARRS